MLDCCISCWFNQLLFLLRYIETDEVQGAAVAAWCGSCYAGLFGRSAMHVASDLPVVSAPIPCFHCGDVICVLALGTPPWSVLGCIRIRGGGLRFSVSHV